MLSQIHYLIRSKRDGQYLVARLRPNESSPREKQQTEPGYLLLFKERFDALSYLNTHAAGLVEQFAVESLPGPQLGGLLKRWGFAGVGIVQDPLLPRIEFLKHSSDW